LPLEGRTVVIVDDGVATGSTARAACLVARAHGAARVVVAVPVAPRGWTERLGGDADEAVCLETPEPFRAIGQFYADFSQTSDDEVVACLERVGPRVPMTGADPERTEVITSSRADDVEVQAGPVCLAGRLAVPEQPVGVVVFAHGSGSSRHSPRNRHVAAVLNHAGLGTLLVDLLTTEEEHDRVNVFDIDLLARRLIDVTRWLGAQPAVSSLKVGYFGASTGAAAALWAAADPEVDIAAVVSRGGRPDLAGPRLSRVAAPTMLIVGGRDEVVLELNRQAQSRLTCENQLAIVPGATHLFEEPGTLQAAAELARDWFTLHLSRIADPTVRS
jgi:putative phosphoribosyl transferase